MLVVNPGNSKSFLLNVGMMNELTPISSQWVRKRTGNEDMGERGWLEEK